MKRILVPTKNASDWRRLLADEELHWKPGRSAMAAAAAWEEASDRLPPEITAALDASGVPALLGLDLLLAVPEWEVALPGGSRASHTDVLAVARNDAGLVVLAVEAKADEPFGPTLGEKRADASPGQQKRIEYLHEVLRIPKPLPDSIRYQLLHRTASAILTARMFHANTAVILVQSFRPKERWGDFEAFGTALGSSVKPDQAAAVPGHDQPGLFLTWCGGNQDYLRLDLRTT